VSGAKAQFGKRKSEFDHRKRAESVYDVSTNILDKLFVKIFICETTKARESRKWRILVYFGVLTTLS
jgi:hypothetical protein